MIDGVAIAPKQKSAKQALTPLIMSESISLKYKLFKLIHDRPDMKQRDLAHALDLSLGKMNYCLKALVDKGFVKAGNFRSSKKIGLCLCLNPERYRRKNPCDLSVLQTYRSRV